VQLQHFAGLGRQMPWTMAAMVVGGLSLIGVPLTVGFISKWYMLTASLENGWWPVAVVVLLGSVLGGIYVWRIVEAAYFKPAPSTGADIKEAPLGLLIPTWILTLANVYFGTDSRLTITITELTAQALLGGSS
jgi:multicomponent Na+:H+ antiporter subunit D